MIEIERRNRIRIAVAAWAYENSSDVIMTDAQFDELAKKIDLSVNTGNKMLDNFFRNEFKPHTGQWVHKHPEQAKLKALCKRIKRLRETP